MRLALLMLLLPALALAQEKKEEAKKQEPARPLILRIDQLPAAERAGLDVHEDKKPGDNLPELGGKPSPAYNAGAVRGSGTEAQGSPYPANTQQGR